MGELHGRRVVLFRVASAIGTACAVALAEGGAELIVVDDDGEVATRVAAALGAATVVVDDLASAEGAARVATAVADRWDALDVLVDCTSAMEHWPAADDTPERLTEVLVTNVMGPLLHTDALRPYLAAAPAASVVYLGSIDGLRANPNVPAYSAGKAGLTAITRAMAARLGADGTRVNCVATGALRQTPESEQVDRYVGDVEALVRLTPLGRVPDPAEIAAVVRFFASDASSYVSGTVLPVDGGRIAATPATW